jgi:hypothetical protein
MAVLAALLCGKAAFLLRINKVEKSEEKMQNKGRKRFVWVTLLGVGMTFASCLFGGDVFWSGATSQNWHTPSNWSSGSVPTNGDTAVIDPAQQAVTRWDFQLTNDAEVAGIRFTNLTQTVSGSASANLHCRWEMRA